MSEHIQSASATVSRVSAPDGERLLMRVMVGLAFAWPAVAILLPLGELVMRSLSGPNDEFVGLANYVRYFQTPALFVSLYNTISVSLAVTTITVPLAFMYAYALTRTAMPGKAFFRGVAVLPLFAPTMMHGLALIYLFGNKGIITTGGFGLLESWLGVPVRLDIGLYGPVGIILAECFYVFPQAVLMLTVALMSSDARLYEAARSMGASPTRTFLTITLPGVKYGLAGALFVCFTLCFTDFGAPKVVGGQFNVMATDIFKHVIGQQNMVMGATVGIILLAPTIVAFMADRVIRRKQAALTTSRAVPLDPKPGLMDKYWFLFCACVAGLILLLMGTVVLASLVRTWPYKMQLGFWHYDFANVGGGGYPAFRNSLRMSVYTALCGTALTFACAYLIEKTKVLPVLRQGAHFLSIVPLALPGLVIGLAYIFFFNRPTLGPAAWGIPNPFNFLYNTMAILVLCNVVHFYSVAYLTATTALKQLDAEFETVSASMAVPFYKTFWRVSVPVCLPAILEIGMYYFVNSMATVSAVIFLYSPDIRLASVAVVSMDDAGDTAEAAAMSVLIVLAGVTARLIYGLATKRLMTRFQAWRQR